MLVRSILCKLFQAISWCVAGAAGDRAGRLQRQGRREGRAPSRPVLVATVHYEAESPERSFVGTIKPRIETDMGFRVPGKVAKRLVEVGQTVDVGQPLATLDEVDLKLQAEQAEAEFRAATGVLAQAAAAEQPRQGFARQGLGHRRAAGSGQGRRRRGARAAQSRRALGRTHQELAVLRDAGRRHPRRRHRDPDRCRARSWPPARPRFASRALPKRKPWSRSPRRWSAAPRTASATVTLWSEPEQEICREAARDRAVGRSGDAHLSREILAARRRRQRLARHDRDADAGRSRRPSAWRGCRCRRCSARAAIPRSMSSTTRAT